VSCHVAQDWVRWPPLAVPCGIGLGEVALWCDAMWHREGEVDHWLTATWH
jgi:hypothetical protein